jgi:hypothetical protein
LIPPNASIFTEAPSQINGAGGEKLIKPPTAVFTVIVVDPVQPFPSVPVTEYDVAIAGNAVTLVPVAELKVVDGLHTYVLAPLAVSVTESPKQMLGFGGVTVMIRSGVTETVTPACPVHPFNVPTTL